MTGKTNKYARCAATLFLAIAALLLLAVWQNAQPARAATTNVLSHTVTAVNRGSTVFQTHTITLERKIYLPLVMHAWPPPSWHSQCVDCPSYLNDLTQNSVAVDSQNRLHVAFGGDRLYHAWREGTAWQIETADPGPDVGQGASIALDGDDHPHIAYRGSDLGLHYAHWDGSQWLTTTVPVNFGSGYVFYTAIALDSANRPYIAYQVHSSMSRFAFRCVYWDGSQWQDAVIESNVRRAGMGLTLAVDGGDRPHIGYAVTDSDGLDLLRHVYWDGSQWQIETAVSGSLSANAMVLDSTVSPRFAYVAFDGSGDSLIEYTWWDGSQWQSEVAVPAGDVGLAGGVSLALDGSEVPHIGYYRVWDQTVEHIYYDGSTWQQETADVGSVRVEEDITALAVDSTGQPHLFYLLTDNTLRHAYRQGSNWQIESVGRGGNPGPRSPPALDSAGRSCIAYYDEVRGELRYARQDGVAWQLQTVDTGQPTDVGQNVVSLALDQADRPHIAYDGYGTFSDIRYAFWDGSTWQIETVDNPFREQGASLALDSSGQPHVAYYAYDYNSGEWGLRYASRQGAAWQHETVDTVGSVGFVATSLVIDSADRPHIAYFDSVGADLKYARWNGSAWQVETVDSEDSGAYRSLALDSADRPHISYFENTNDDLKYAHWDGAAWQTETVDSAGKTGYCNSLALDAVGHPHISYLDDTDHLIKYAHWDGAQWQIETAASGNVYWYTSLALNAGGQPRISYYDIGLQDLRYTWWGP